MFLPRKFLIAMFVVSVIACLYNSVGANTEEDNLVTVLRRFTEDKSDGQTLKEKESFLLPLEILSAIIRRFLEIVTWPIRVPYRLLSSLLAAVGLLLLGCTIVPITICPERVSQELIPDFMNSLRDEMEFLATLVDEN